MWIKLYIFIPIWKFDSSFYCAIFDYFYFQVEKLCHRFHATTTERQWRDIGFCLSIFNYNDKAAKKFIENFSCFSDKLHEDSLYEAVLAILTQVKYFTLYKMCLFLGGCILTYYDKYCWTHHIRIWWYNLIHVYDDTDINSDYWNCEFVKLEQHVEG